VVSVTDSYGRILGFLDRSRYFTDYVQDREIEEATKAQPRAVRP
jgi:hypothetical protein